MFLDAGFSSAKAIEGGWAAWVAAGYQNEVTGISVGDVKAKLEAGSNIVIVDSRAKTAYDTNHIAGAISIPLSDMSPLSPEEITQRYSDLHSYDEILTYCE
jgi:rhodanese-related sulfurtransferase